MKFKSIHKWDYKEELEGLLFFAQRLDELLFDYTLDTYKPSALNSSFLCREALQLIAEIDKNIIDKANLKHILEELDCSLRTDEVAKELIQLETSDYVLKNDIENISLIKIRLELLQNCIRPHKYLKKTISLLKDSIKNNHKKRIDFLSKTFITTLVNFGYHQTYIHKTSLEFFFYDTKTRISDLNCLDIFFDNFNLKKSKYEVIFRVSNLISEIKDSCEIFNISISETLPKHLSRTKKSLFKKRPDDIFLTIENIEVFDQYTARELSERLLNKIKSFFVLFHHKKGVKWHEEALVICRAQGKEFLLFRPIGPMKKGFDLKAEKAAKELNNFINNFRVTGLSFEKIDRVIDFHGLAISNQTPENQLINLWTSIETIIPSHPSRSKITNIINSLTPFLILDYTNRLLSRLTSDLILWNRPTVTKIFKKIPKSKGLSPIEKTAILISLQETKDLRDELYAKLNDFSLLRNRVYTLSQILSDPKKIEDILSIHQTKIEWQIRRIYRTRNLIIHSGRTPHYTNILIENAHTYLDQFLEAVLHYSINESSINSIEQAVELGKLKYQNYIKTIKESKNFITIDTYKEILLN